MRKSTRPHSKTTKELLYIKYNIFHIVQEDRAFSVFWSARVAIQSEKALGTELCVTQESEQACRIQKSHFSLATYLIKAIISRLH